MFIFFGLPSEIIYPLLLSLTNGNNMKFQEFLDKMNTLIFHYLASNLKLHWLWSFPPPYLIAL